MVKVNKKTAMKMKLSNCWCDLKFVIFILFLGAQIISSYYFEYFLIKNIAVDK